MKTVVVVGGGLVGSLGALTMAQLGFKVKLVERNLKAVTDEMDGNEIDKSAVKRSINLALSYRGQQALKNVGLLEWAMKIAVPMYGRAIHVGDERLFQRYDEIDDSNFINSISREGLNHKLLQEAEKNENVQVIYNKILTHIDRDGVLHFVDFDKAPRGATFNDHTPGTLQIPKPDLTLGCDGAYSVVRSSLLRLQSTNFNRQYIRHSYKELSIAPDPLTGDFQLDHVNALHIWPRGEFMMIALPNPDKSFTCTLFAPTADLDANETPEQISHYFAEYFKDVVPLMPDYIEQYQKNPTCRLVMSTVSPWNMTFKSGGQVVVLGDAAHAMVPFYGQGMNCGMEDVLELAETLKLYDLDLEKAIPAFSSTRPSRGNAAVRLSLRNYEEMRSHTASRLFLLRKKIEGGLNWAFPNSWIPLYKMVAFTRTPYDKAIEIEARQDTILKAITVSLVLLGAATIGLGAASLANKNFK